MRQPSVALVSYRPLALPGLTCEPLMEERLAAYVPRDHELAGRASVSFADLGAREFVVLEGIGVWWPVVERAMPHATFVRQTERPVMEQLLAISPALAFTTDASGAFRGHENRVAVPISDPEARMRFYLLAPAG